VFIGMSPRKIADLGETSEGRYIHDYAVLQYHYISGRMKSKILYW
jgi:hypothetical protein